MIDEKKIKQAAIECADEYYPVDLGIDKEELCRELFTKGAHWAINEFLKDLWHDASEKPTRGKLLLTQSVSDKGSNLYEYEVETATHVLDYCREFPLYRWLYIDDLLTKRAPLEYYSSSLQ